jgi:hypothetical protein
MLTTGGESLTVTVKLHRVVLPEESVAVQATLVVPVENVELKGANTRSLRFLNRRLLLP